jgi:hypothetical protein
MSDPLHLARVAAKRLETYSRRTKDKIWSGQRADFINALADVAEVNEISRRLYGHLENLIKNSTTVT